MSDNEPRRGASPAVAGALASAALHELRNLLAIIETSATLAADSIEDRAFVARHLEKVKRNSHLAQLLVARFLAVAAGAPLEVETVTLETVLREAGMEAVGSGGAMLVIDAEARNTEISCEPALLGRALANLVDNALEAIASSGRGSRVEVTARSAGEVTTIAVADDGPGLPRDVAFANKTTKESGHGLGMLIARALVQVHGGKLEVVEREGWSTVLEIRVPRGG
ncbi:MAG: HAMP domain-containing histidine kinase [Polyangiaceae bacterium]|nr:HAMP domain-containing histidine kinase [Polyangiaceae bacterium]